MNDNKYENLAHLFIHRNRVVCIVRVRENAIFCGIFDGVCDREKVFFAESTGCGVHVFRVFCVFFVFVFDMAGGPLYVG